MKYLPSVAEVLFLIGMVNIIFGVSTLWGWAVAGLIVGAITVFVSLFAMVKS